MKIGDAIGGALALLAVMAFATTCVRPAIAEDAAYITLTAAYCHYPANKIVSDKKQDCTVRVYRLEDKQDMAYCELIRDAIVSDGRSNVSARCDFID